MSTKKIYSSALALAIFSVAAHAQDLLPQPLTLDPVKVGAPVPDGASVNAAPPALSSWITYTKPECCGPIGGNGPVGYELFLRSGPSLPVEGKFFGHTLATGWDIEGGARSLFFNPAMDRDWSIDLSLRNVFNRGQHSDRKVPYNVIVPSGTNPITGAPTGFTTTPINISVRELNRTDASVGLGRDWYLSGTAKTCDENRWRAGIDAGGRLGTTKLETYELSHRTDTIGGVYVGVHTDLEIPRGCCTFLVGFRAEWDYTWMDILQSQNNADVMDVSFLVTFGVRF